MARRRFAAPLGQPQHGRPALDGERSLASLRSAPCPLALADVPLTEQRAACCGLFDGASK